MKSISSSENTPFLVGFLSIKSELGLEEIGMRVAERIVTSGAFEGRENFIRDEVPAIRIRDVLGCSIVLQGDSHEGYNLTLEPNVYPHEKIAKPVQVDVSGLLASLLDGVKGIELGLD